ncbi:MAG TPA: hypothetical protein DEF42_07060, partial [Desulfosporosinus sp.]|nr:hypothetical protein [Desulfosporosinus sp.]
EAQAKADAEALAEARAQAEVQAKADAEALAEARAQAEAQAKVYAEALAEARAQAEAQAKADAEALAEARAQAEAQSKAHEEALAQVEIHKAEAKALAEALAQAEEQAKADEQALAEALAQAETQSKADAVAIADALAQVDTKLEALIKIERHEQVMPKISTNDCIEHAPKVPALLTSINSKISQVFDASLVPQEADLLKRVLNNLFPKSTVYWNKSLMGENFLAQVEDVLIYIHGPEKPFNQKKFNKAGWKVLVCTNEDLAYPRRLEREIRQILRSGKMSQSS